jgi:hypothetical protein
MTVRHRPPPPNPAAGAAPQQAADRSRTPPRRPWPGAWYTVRDVLHPRRQRGTDTAIEVFEPAATTGGGTRQNRLHGSAQGQPVVQEGGAGRRARHKPLPHRADPSVPGHDRPVRRHDVRLVGRPVRDRVPVFGGRVQARHRCRSLKGRGHHHPCEPSARCRDVRAASKAWRARWRRAMARWW